MWKKFIKNLELTPSSQGDQLESDVEDDFLSILDPNTDENKNREMFCFRQLLVLNNFSSDTDIKPNGIQKEFVLGELNLFKDNPIDAIKACTQLTLSFNNFFKRVFTCDIFTTPTLPDKFNFNKSHDNVLKEWQCCLLLDKNQKKISHPIALEQLEPYVYNKSLNNALDLNNLDGFKNNLFDNLTLLFILNNKNFDAVELTTLVQKNNKLTNALLTHVNKIFLGTSVHAESVDHAISLLGQDRFLCWLAAMALINLSELLEKPATCLTALRRASLLVHLTDISQQNKVFNKKLFFASIFSILSGLINLEDEQMFTELKLYAQNNFNLKLDKLEQAKIMDVFNVYSSLIQSIEELNWIKLRACLKDMNISEKHFNNAFWSAIKWENTL